jgi:hypothetical protein
MIALNYRAIPQLVIGCLCLAACTKPAEPGIRTVEVLVPTPVACVKADQIPAEPPRVTGTLTGDARADLSIVAESALSLRKYGGQLRALLEGCQQ